MFSSKLKQIRKQSKISQEELAKKLGVSRSTISMWECGEREPDFETAEKIADFFNIPLNTLISKNAIDSYVINLKNEQLKFALFDTTDISDDKLNQVLEYAEFIKNK